MNRFLHFLIMLTAAVLLAACASLPQRLVLQPTVPPPEADAAPVAARQEVPLRIVDSRLDSTLGCFEHGKGECQPFLATRELDIVVREAVAAGMRSKGFIPLAGVQENRRSLTVEIQHFNHHLSSGLVKVSARTNIALKTMAVNGGRSLTGYYTVDKQEVLVVRPGIRQNQKLVNEALDAVLEKIFQDRKLWQLLAGQTEKTPMQ